MYKNYEFDRRTGTKNLPQFDWEHAFKRATGSTEAPIASKALQRFVSNVGSIPLSEALLVIESAWEDGELLRVIVALNDTLVEEYYMLLPYPSLKGPETLKLSSMILWSQPDSNGGWLNQDPTGPHDPVGRFELIARLCERPGSHLPDEVNASIVDHIELLGPFQESDDGIGFTRQYTVMRNFAGPAVR